MNQKIADSNELKFLNVKEGGEKIEEEISAENQLQFLTSLSCEKFHWKKD